MRPKYGVIDSQPEQEKRAVIVAQGSRRNRRPNLRGKVAWHGMPGTDGRITHNYAAIIVYELEAEGPDVSKKCQSTN
jgi:hypothetical protein